VFGENTEAVVKGKCDKEIRGNTRNQRCKSGQVKSDLKDILKAATSITDLMGKVLGQEDIGTSRAPVGYQGCAAWPPQVSVP
jgi:hypothetical protein